MSKELTRIIPKKELAFVRVFERQAAPRIAQGTSESKRNLVVEGRFWERLTRLRKLEDEGGGESLRGQEGKKKAVDGTDTPWDWGGLNTGTGDELNLERKGEGTYRDQHQYFWSPGKSSTLKESSDERTCQLTGQTEGVCCHD